MTATMQTAHMDSPVVVNSDQARQMAQRELAKPQYHTTTTTSSPSPASPPPQQQPPSPGHALTIILVILAAIVLVVVVVVVLRWLGRPRTEKKPKKAAKEPAATAAEEALVGAARHRHAALSAAEAGDWAEAIRERFRAVIATLDERGLLPERPDRTADEAARDAGALLPAHAGVLAAAARAFDDVEYGEYVGTAEGYRLISEVDELVGGARAESVAAGGAR